MRSAVSGLNSRQEMGPLPNANPSTGADPLGSPLARAAFEAATEGLLVLGCDGVVIAVNGACCALCGIDSEELVGRHHSVLSEWLEVSRSGGQADSEAWVTLRALKGERVLGVTQTIRNRQTGVEFIARCGAAPLFEGDRLVATTVTVQDITETTRIRHAIEGALSAAEVGTYRIDLKSSQVWGDPNFARIHGLTEEEVNGGPLSRVYELIDARDRERVTQQVAEITRWGGVHELEYRVALPEGERWILSRGTVESDEHGLAFRRIGSIVDVTAQKEAEEKLQRTQDSLSLAMRGGRMGWWRRDLVTGEVVWSRELEAIFGLEAGTFDGTRQSFLDFVHLEDRAALNTVVAKALATGEDYEVEFRFTRADGVEGWLEGRGKAFYDDIGRPIASYGLGVDVTERKAVEAALRRSGEAFESLVRTSPLGVYAVDADFRLSLVSQGAQRVFENVRPLIGRDFSEVMRTVWEEPFASEAIGLFRRTLETGESYHAPSTVERREDLGETEAYDWKIERVAMPDGRLGVVCHFYDLSERQRQEAELQRRVEERTKDLTRANRDLDEFAYSVAHDLRAPLRAIVSTSRILLEDAGERLTEAEQETLRRQASNGLRLAGIVDDLLGFARLAKAEPKRSDFDLTALAKDIARETAARWNNACRTEIQEGIRANGDPNLVGYALTNLLDNACKFSPRGGTIRFGQNDGVFFVRDEGVGFDMAHAHKLFVAFERLVDQETFAGTGVGLANVKRIIEKHGGKVWAESELGRGATFYFTLAPTVP